MAGTRGGPVVVIDDDSAVLDSLKFLLEVAGHEVAVYASGVAFLEDKEVRPACIILDHHMPQMTGLELTARLQELGMRLPVLLITGSPTPAIMKRAVALGIEKVLEKPPSEEELLNFVCAYC